jgi:hypothetical protein
MNLNSVPDRTAGEVQALVDNEMNRIADAKITRGLRKFLITPRLELRTWDWQKPLKDYPVWVIAESSKYDYGIAFSDYGFAPERSWGLIFLSHGGFDADYCWYSTLESCYKESRIIAEHEEEPE